MENKRQGTLLKATIVVCISLLGVLSIAELGLRLVARSGAFPEFFLASGNTRPPLDKRTGPGMYYAHPYTAYALKPNYKVPGREQINSLGFRGEEISLEKPEGVYRIVAVGGSTTFAVYLPWNQSYPYYLQKELRERLGTDKIEVINAGLTGATTAESFHRMATQVLPLNPDMVVMYEAFNDLLPRVFNDYQEDYYHFRKSDPNNPPGLTRFYLYRLALLALSPGAFHENNNLSKYVWKTENLPDTDTERTRNFLRSSSNAYRFNMENIVSLLKARGVSVVLASFAINPDIWHWQDALPAYVWEAGIAQNNSVVEELSAEYQLPLIPFAEAPFVAASQDYKARMYTDSIHMGNEGDQFQAIVFADTIAPIVAAELGLPIPPPSKYAPIQQSAPPPPTGAK